MLKIVHSPYISALDQVTLTSAKLFHLARLAILYQAFKAGVTSAWVLAASFSFFRLITRNLVLPL
jgi:hypothetical protein